MPEKNGPLKKEEEHFKKLFIGGLTYSTTDEMLQEFYSQWGELTDCIVMRDSSTKRSRGFGFVTYKESEMLDASMEKRPHIIDGKEVEPKRAVPREFSDKAESQMSVKKLFVSGIKEEHTSEMLRDYFSQYGEILDVDIMVDKVTGKKRGFAFVTFTDYDPVDKCVLKKSHMIDGKRCDVKKALSKEELSKAQQQERDRSERDVRSRGFERGGGDSWGGRGGGYGGGPGRDSVWGANDGSYGGGWGNPPSSGHWGNPQGPSGGWNDGGGGWNAPVGYPNFGPSGPPYGGGPPVGRGDGGYGGAPWGPPQQQQQQQGGWQRPPGPGGAPMQQNWSQPAAPASNWGPGWNGPAAPSGNYQAAGGWGQMPPNPPVKWDSGQTAINSGPYGGSMGPGTMR